MILNHQVTDAELLKKIIQILTCVIHGHGIRALLRNETKFLSQKSDADLITIYINRDNSYKIDFISDKRRLFCKLMDKYKFNKHSPAFGDVGQEIINNFNSAKPYHQTSELYEFLKGTLTKNRCEEMRKEIQFKTALFFPLQLTGGKKIGFVSYFYTRDKEPDIEKLKEVSTMIQQVVDPLYDPITSTFYSKCTQVDSDMSRLTDKEKEIVHRVIKGMSYKEVSEELKMSINTLKTHMKNVFSKYGVASKTELSNTLLMHVKRKQCK
jgi:DNA-binding CsgD family transcriptional regulator